jgi:hypothetical protein
MSDDKSGIEKYQALNKWSVMHKDHNIGNANIGTPLLVLLCGVHMIG